MLKPNGYFNFLDTVRHYDTPYADWLKRPVNNSTLQHQNTLYGDHVRYANAGAYVLDYTQQQYLHFDEATSRSLTGHRSHYLLKGGLQAGLDLWDKNDLAVYDQEIQPSQLDFIASIPMAEISKYLFECTYRVHTKAGEVRNVLQKSFFVHSTDNKLPTLVCGFLFDLTGYKTDNAIHSKVHKHLGTGQYEQVQDQVFFPAYEDRRLSRRETEVLQGFCYHYSLQEIANKLHISVNTVKNHLKNIRRKTECGSDAELFVYGMNNGLLRK